MELKELMRAFTAAAGLGEPETDDAGGYTFAIDDVTVSFRERTETQELITVSEVGELPDEGAEHVYRLLMEAMFRDGGSGGAIFSLEPDSKRIWAHRRDSLATMDDEGFRSMLERFVNGMEEWRRLVGGLSELAPKLAEAKESAALENRELSMNTEGFMRI